jgi:hypothetical protein
MERGMIFEQTSGDFLNLANPESRISELPDCLQEGHFL